MDILNLYSDENIVEPIDSPDELMDDPTLNAYYKLQERVEEEEHREWIKVQVLHIQTVMALNKVMEGTKDIKDIS